MIIVEGETELEFVKTILKPYLNQNGISDVSASKIKHSKGGLNKYAHLTTDIFNCIYQSDVIVTTLIDYYGLPNDFPKYEEIKSSSISAIQKVEKLENAIKENIEINKNIQTNNFIPYIQLHEFEALIFSNIETIKKLYKSNEFNFNGLDKIISEYPNPEEINDSVNTAPSKRLISLYKGYDKVLDGNLILREIGIKTLLNKCNRFNSWVIKIIEEFNK